MAIFNKIQNAFSAGELSPRFFSRTDLAQYNLGAETVENFLVQPQGGLTKRPGSQYEQDAISDTDVRLIPFIFSETEAYLIEITTGTSNQFKFTNIDTGTSGFISVDTSSLTGGLVPDQGYTSTELPEIQYAQKGDLLYLVHPNKIPAVIVRTAQDTFTVRPFYYGPNDNDEVSTTQVGLRTAFMDVNTNTAHTMTLSAVAAGSRTITSSVDFFDDLHVGAAILFSDGSNQGGYGIITAVSTATSATIEVHSAAPAGFGSGSSEWAEGAFSNYRGWPRTVCFFQGRIYYGGTTYQPDTVYASAAGNITNLTGEDFKPTVTLTADDPYNFTIASVEANEIQWLSPSKTLSIGTRGREYIARGSDNSESMNATNIIVSPESSHGSAYIQPARVGSGVIFIQKNYQKVREFVFNFEQDAFSATDLTIAADHVVKKSVEYHASFSAPKVVGMAYQESDNGVLWIIDNNGGLTGLTRDTKNGIIAFHRHKFGGDLSDETPKVVSIAVIPNADATHDDVWVAVERSIQSDSSGSVSTKIYIEKIGQEFDLADIDNSSALIQNKAVYSDSSKLLRQSTSTRVYYGWDHIAGENADCVAAGSYVGQHAVAFGDNEITNGDAETDTSGWSTYSDSFVSVTESAASSLVDTDNDYINSTAHGLTDGTYIRYTTTGDVIGGLTAGDVYQVVSVETDKFKLADVPDGTIVTLTGIGSGDHTFNTVSPLDGTGGTPTITFTRNTTTPITGTGDFKFTTPGGGSVQGQGVAYDFSVTSSSSDQGYRLTFNYDSSDGNYSADVRVFLYDRSRNQFINLHNSMALIAAGSSSGSYDTHFLVPAGVTDLRLIFHVSTSNSSAYSIYFDDVSITKKGVITLDEKTTELVAGLNYTSTMKSLSIEAGSQIGSSQGSIKRIDRLALQFSRTIGGKAGKSTTESDLRHIEFRGGSLVMSNAIPLFSGKKVLRFDGESERDVYVVFVHDLPLPCTLLGYVARGQTND